MCFRGPPLKPCTLARSSRPRQNRGRSSCTLSPPRALRTPTTDSPCIATGKRRSARVHPGGLCLPASARHARGGPRTRGPAGAPIAVARAPPKVRCSCANAPLARHVPGDPALPAPPPAKSAETPAQPAPRRGIGACAHPNPRFSRPHQRRCRSCRFDYPGAWLGRAKRRGSPTAGTDSVPLRATGRLGVDGCRDAGPAPQMTRRTFPSRAGPGVARLRVSGGFSRPETVGLIGLIGGLPVTFAGVTLLGVGTIREPAG